MKNTLQLIVLFISLNTFAQTKKLEVTNTVSGKAIIFESSQRVKITTIDRKKLVGLLTIIDSDNIAIDGVSVKVDNILSVKNHPKKERTTKNIVLGTGLGLITSSGVAAAFSNGSAFSLFAVGTGTTIIGGLINNSNKTLIKRKNNFKIIE